MRDIATLPPLLLLNLRPAFSLHPSRAWAAQGGPPHSLRGLRRSIDCLLSRTSLRVIFPECRLILLARDGVEVTGRKH